MGGRFGRRYELPGRDLQQLIACVVEHAQPSEARDVERVLGLLSTLALTASAHDDSVSFVAPRGTAYLVDRALEAMARSNHRYRRRSDPRVRRQPSAPGRVEQMPPA